MSLDLNNIASNNGLTQVFYNSGYWNKPRGVHMAHIIAISGGNGGNGGTSSPGANGTGGQGGSSGIIVRVTIPLIFLTDELIIYVGLGGEGGASGGFSGGGGDETYVDCARGTAQRTSLVVNTSNANSLGWVYGSLGQNLYSSSVGGSSGGNGAAGTSAIFGSTLNLPLLSGMGGGGHTAGGTNFSGGSILTSGFVPQIVGGTTGVNNGRGNGGFFSLTPFASTGGSGGASNASGTGGVGGDGAIGSGGGGGGSGTIGGVGGRGGNGLVIITCW
jgi:hypothetical protein